MKRKNIAVLMTALDSDGQAEILKGIEAFGKANGYNVAVFLWFTGVYEKERHNHGEINIAMLPNLNLFDGIILFANIFHIEVNCERIDKLLKHVSCPVVTIGCKYNQAPAVWADNYSGMRSLMEYLVKDRGFRRLHFVKGIEGNADAEARFKAYVDVLEENGIPVIPERISQGDFYVVGGETAAKDILRSTLPFPEAIVCANDTMAITVYDILTEKGYHIPEDVVITGYDYTFECRLHYPEVISIRIKGKELGKQACRMLHEMLAGNKVESDVWIPDETVLKEPSGLHSVGKNAEFTVPGESLSSDAIKRKEIHHIITLEKNVMENTGFDSWKDAVKMFVEQIDPREFYFCANKHFVENVFESATVEQENMSIEECLEYSEEVDVLLAYKDGRFIEKASFASKYGFDELFEESEDGKLCIFSPLHYLDRNFGYFVFCNSNFPIGNPLYITWLNYMGHSIENIRKQSVLKNAMARLNEMYIRDSLTGVYNRFGMEKCYARIKQECQKTNALMQISFADIDGLKQINDKYGHEEGDRVIRALGRILDRESEKNCVARYGGDEFIVIGTADSERKIEDYWQRVQDAIGKYNALEEGKAILSVSFGYDIVNPEIDSLDSGIHEADQRMYIEKKRKKAKREV